MLLVLLFVKMGFAEDSSDLQTQLVISPFVPYRAIIQQMDKVNFTSIQLCLCHNNAISYLE